MVPLVGSASSHNSRLPPAPTGSQRLPTAQQLLNFWHSHPCSIISLYRNEISIYSKYIIVLLVGKSPCQLCLLVAACNVYIWVGIQVWQMSRWVDGQRGGAC